MNEIRPETPAAKHYNDFSESYTSWTEGSEAGLHFGIVKKFSDVFNNAQMIRNLSDLVISCIKKEKSQRILDAGCGMGHVMMLVEQNERLLNSEIHGITLSGKQKAIGDRFLESKNSKAHISLQNFESTSFLQNYFDTALYVESLSYGKQSNKNLALKEAARIIKPGGEIIITDAFLKKDLNSFSRPFRFLGKRAKNFWGIESWIVEKDFLACAKEHSFSVDENKDLKWRTSASMLHILFKWFPYVLFGFVARKVPFSSVKFVLKIIVYIMPFTAHPAFRYKCIVLRKALWYYYPMKHLYVITLPEYGHLLPLLRYVDEKHPKTHLHILAPKGHEEKVSQIAHKTLSRYGVTILSVNGEYRAPQTFSPYTVFSHFHSTLSFAHAAKKFLLAIPSKEEASIILDAVLEYLLDQDFLRAFPDVQIFHAILPLQLKTFLRYKVPLTHIFGPLRKIPKESMKAIELFRRLNAQSGVSIPMKNFHKNFSLPRILSISRGLDQKIDFPKDFITEKFVSAFQKTEIVPAELERFVNQKKVIYISFGTVFDQDEGIYKEIISSIPESEAIVISCKPEQILALKQMLSAKSRCYIGSVLPQNFILKHSKLFVTHGGFNSINEAIEWAVPMIVVPHMYEQELNAKILTSVNLSTMVAKEEIKNIRPIIQKYLA